MRIRPPGDCRTQGLDALACDLNLARCETRNQGCGLGIGGPRGVLAGRLISTPAASCPQRACEGAEIASLDGEFAIGERNRPSDGEPGRGSLESESHALERAGQLRVETQASRQTLIE